MRRSTLGQFKDTCLRFLTGFCISFAAALRRTGEPLRIAAVLASVRPLLTKKRFRPQRCCEWWQCMLAIISHGLYLRAAHLCDAASGIYYIGFAGFSVAE